MRRLVVSFVVVLGWMSVTVGGASGAGPSASCNGILVSSLAGQPGVVGVLTRQFHQEAKDAGIPPGFFDVAGAQVHAGSIVPCLQVLG